jgi:hypothetical protein
LMVLMPFFFVVSLMMVSALALIFRANADELYPHKLKSKKEARVNDLVFIKIALMVNCRVMPTSVIITTGNLNYRFF